MCVVVWELSQELTKPCYKNFNDIMLVLVHVPIPPLYAESKTDILQSQTAFIFFLMLPGSVNCMHIDVLSAARKGR